LVCIMANSLNADLEIPIHTCELNLMLSISDSAHVFTSVRLS
jgi:hypothetical protein